MCAPAYELTDARPVVVAAAFGSLLLELYRFPVPSEASVYQLLTGRNRSAHLHSPSTLVPHRESLRTLFAYVLPTAVGVALFLVPLLGAFWPTMIDYLGPFSRLRTRWALWFGTVLVIGGRVITFTASLQLHPAKLRAELQRSGLFRWSRNPGLVGMYTFYLGLCFMFPCVVLFAGLVPYVWNMHVRVLMEERYLISTFGAVYQHYLGRVPRYLLF